MGRQRRTVLLNSLGQSPARWGLVGIALWLLFPLMGVASSLNWIHQLGTSREDLLLGITVDAADDVIVTGRTNGNIGGTPLGNFDAWLAKYSTVGGLLWKRQLGTTRNDTANAIATDRKGDIVIAGSTEGVLEGVNRGKSDIWLAKYDGQGNFIWREQFGTQAVDSALGIATDNANQIYLVGYTEGRLNLRGASKPADAWLAKVDANGTVAWIKQIGSAGEDYATAVKVDLSGNIYLCGATSGDIAGSFGEIDAWIAKYDASGELVWKRQLGTQSTDRALALTINAEGEVLLTGVTNGNLGGTQKGGTDAWVVKYSANGRTVWKKQLGTEANDRATGVVSDLGGAVYLTGQTEGNLGSSNKGEIDAWIVKYNPRGGLVWKRQVGTALEDTANGIAIDSKNNLYIGGDTQGNLGSSSAGLFDAWLAKYLQ